VTYTSCGKIKTCELSIIFSHGPGSTLKAENCEPIQSLNFSYVLRPQGVMITNICFNASNDVVVIITER